MEVKEKSKFIVLHKPIKIRKCLRSHMISVIHIREPKVKDILGIDFSKGNEAFICLASRVSGIPEESIHEMSLPDFNQLSIELGKLMNGVR